ncbi:hypothetical protein HJ590_13085 [Naumannella sp. ID2617S]|nr:hypothetical protein [Naumannella sp. ID2617S]
MSEGRMSAAEFACWRHLLGLTLDELADELAVHPRTVRSWEVGQQSGGRPAPVPDGVVSELAEMKREHDALVQRILDAEDVMGIVRDKSAAAPMPRGWYVAAAARAMERDPDLMVEWVRDTLRE